MAFLGCGLTEFDGAEDDYRTFQQLKFPQKFIFLVNFNCRILK